MSLLLLGTSYGANAATINDGDTLIGSANINVTKDDTAQTITITTNGLATTAELNINKANIAANTAQIGTNTVDINTNKANIADNTVQIGINASAINSNKEDISDLKAVNAVLGLDKDKAGMKYFRANSTGYDAYATGVDAIAVGKMQGLPRIRLLPWARKQKPAVWVPLLSAQKRKKMTITKEQKQLRRILLPSVLIRKWLKKVKWYCLGARGYYWFQGWYDC